MKYLKIKRISSLSFFYFFSPAGKACHVLSLCAALLPSRNLYSERRKHCLCEVGKIFHFCLYIYSCVEYFRSDSFPWCIFDLCNLPDFFLAWGKSSWQLKGKYSLSFWEELPAPVAGSSSGLCCQRTQQIWDLVLMLQQISLWPWAGHSVSLCFTSPLVKQG